MRKLLLFMGMFVASASFADVSGDMMVAYTASKDDTYANSTQPIKGLAWYALVWTKPGCVFAGFKSDGTLINTLQDDLFAAVMLDRGETCLFEIAKTEFDQRKKEGWSMAVYLLDTRDSNGAIAKVNKATGLPERVSRWGLASSSDVIFRANDQIPAILGGAKTSSDLTQTASGEPIKITDLTIDGDDVVITVANTDETCSYDVVSGETAGNLSESSGEQNGTGVNTFRFKDYAKRFRTRMFTGRRTR